MKIIYGGHTDNSVGYFIHPTIVQSTNPKSKLMVEEIFGILFSFFCEQLRSRVDNLRLS